MSDKKATEQAAPAAEPSTTGVLPAEHWMAQDVPADNSDADSALGTDAESSTASITSSILQYRTLYGRTYHSERGDAQYCHHALTMALDGKLYLAPISKNIEKAIDIGTGTGIWAIDFADDFPDTDVIGTDISPIQPSWVPPNLKFEIEDFSQPWTFEDNSVDYVHMRWLLGSVKDWDELFKQAYRILKPGGYIESFEPSSVLTSDDGTVRDTDAIAQWGKIFAEGGKKIDQVFTVYEDGLQRKGMETAGFVDIEEHEFKTPVGGWPKDQHMNQIGRIAQAIMDQDVEGYILFIANTLGWSRQQILVYLAMFRREVKSGKHHTYYSQRILWARKPE
ncbi:Phosphoethanolamine N-methyltransferase 1 [Madurella mycetomatis]|uniref:Phosphoethanolamine N-methyltransferase 1 n=1 Tax=Madurella mycetomatis TaxID=100816 RepID=A0A175VUX3_9PEZI|nr:Phosphoethanolamine N-methyltransferase 1 [Madurella mycetomatis]